MIDRAITTQAALDAGFQLTGESDPDLNPVQPFSDLKTIHRFAEKIVEAYVALEVGRGVAETVETECNDVATSRLATLTRIAGLVDPAHTITDEMRVRGVREIFAGLDGG